MKRSDIDMIAQDMVCIAGLRGPRTNSERMLSGMNKVSIMVEVQSKASGYSIQYCIKNYLEEAGFNNVIVELMKDREPKKLRCIRRLTKVMKGICPVCEMEIESVIHGRITNFCKFCGQAVKWDE